MRRHAPRASCAARRCLSDSRSFASTANARVAWPTHRLKWPISRHAAAHNRWTAARAASVVARSRASRKYFRAALGALRMQASPLAALARAAAARLPPCSSRTKRSRSCSARKPRASCEAIDACASRRLAPRGQPCGAERAAHLAESQLVKRADQGFVKALQRESYQNVFTGLFALRPHR